MSDLLKRLSEQANMRGLAGAVEIEAYDEIKRLRADNTRLLRQRRRAEARDRIAEDEMDDQDGSDAAEALAQPDGLSWNELKQKYGLESRPPILSGRVAEVVKRLEAVYVEGRASDIGAVRNAADLLIETECALTEAQATLTTIADDPAVPEWLRTLARYYDGGVRSKEDVREIVGRKWLPTHKHYKGSLYEVLGYAQHSETLEMMTVYRDERGNMWTRPRAMFDEILPSGQHRFERLAALGLESIQSVCNWPKCNGKQLLCFTLSNCPSRAKENSTK